MSMRWACAGVVLLAAAAVAQLAMWGGTSTFEAVAPTEVERIPALPAGTILPAQLEKPISVSEARSGEPIQARIMQDVPLPNREKLKARSVIKGLVVSAGSDSEDSGAKVTLKFDQIEDGQERLQVTTYLRAIASERAVQAAQVGRSGADTGSPSGWADTVLIGGDVRYGDGGVVTNKAKEKVGKGVLGGVLVHVRANPARGCDGAPKGEDILQALWIFSSDACGVYDLAGVKIARFGRGTPIGEITLHFEQERAQLEADTAMLLCVTSR
jgi:hypothetical protein